MEYVVDLIIVEMKKKKNQTSQRKQRQLQSEIMKRRSHRVVRLMSTCNICIRKMFLNFKSDSDVHNYLKSFVFVQPNASKIHMQ